MKIAVFTTFHNEGYKLYGRRMIASFAKHWPKEVELHVYCEDVKPDVVSDRIIYKDLHASCPDLVKFKERHKNNPLAHGKDKKGNWRLKSFKYMAVRFSHKVYCMHHAATTIDADILIWLDADSHTFDTIPMDFIKEVVEPTKKNFYCTYIGRPGNFGMRARRWSECGFMAYNMNHPEHKNFHNKFKSMYDNDEIFNLQEWHDSWIFDRVRERFEKKGVRNKNLNKTGNKRHPFINTVLGRYIDHLKGEQRKKHRKSHQNGRDLEVNHNVKYWKK